jgi:two-component system chemotaxis sensor kinase CheA
MDDLIAEFLTETNESLQELDTDLIKLEQNPNDKDLISKIFRLMHTIKGTCGFLGLPRLETVAHRAENVMGRFREGNLLVTPAYVSLILESLDRVRYLLGHIEANGTEPEGADTDLIEKLDAVYEGRDAGQSGGAAPVAAPSEPIAPATAAPSTSFPVAAELEAEIAAAQAAAAPIAAAPTPTPVAAPAAAPASAPSAPPKDAGDAKESAIAGQSLRVNVDVLENLMTMVSELVLTRNQLLQILRVQKEKDSNFSTPLQRLNHVVSDLQEGVMKTRMQPIGNAWAKLPRIIRDISIELGKKIDLVMTGQDTELDRQVLEMIKDPLTHMVRNSADHGVEPPADRIKAGKPETGTVHLRAYHEGGHIIIEIADDGRGLPLEKIKKKIVQNGIATEEEVAKMSPQQIQQYIFHAGFSTAEKVTSVSGRGVGMDVVRTNIEKIGGSIEMKSVEGKGSTFAIKIPLTLAIVSSLIVEVTGERFAIPQLAVRELVLVSQKSENRIEMIKNTPVFRLREKLLPLISLEDLLKLGAGDRSDTARFDHKYIIVTQVGQYSFGIIVDRVFDTEEIVVKPVTKILRHIEMFSGNTILGDGSVIMILDPGGIAKATGEMAVSDDSRQASGDASRHHYENKSALLLFTAGGDAPKAVPLSLISRLENIDLSTIERTDGTMLVQYRGTLMPIIPFNPGVHVPSEGAKPLLVFADRGKSVGIVVDQIIDIREEVIDVQVDSSVPGIVGSAIICGKATEVIDVIHFLNSVHGDWFKDHGDEPFLKGKNGTGSGKKSILLVDDSPFFRNMLCPLLSVAGYDVTAVDGPIKALELADKGMEFDLIVSDIEMPDMDGFEFASRVRAGSPWAETPMVALTSHATPEDIDHGYKVGFTKYVAKFDRETLLSALSQTLATAIHEGVSA